MQKKTKGLNHLAPLPYIIWMGQQMWKQPLQRKAERKTALSNWRKSKRFPRYIGKRMRTMLISLKTPIFLPICTGCHQGTAPIRSPRKQRRQNNWYKYGHTVPLDCVTVIFCPFSAEHTANQAAGFTMKSAVFFVLKKFFEFFRSGG